MILQLKISGCLNMATARSEIDVLLFLLNTVVAIIWKIICRGRELKFLGCSCLNDTNTWSKFYQSLRSSPKELWSS